MAGGNFDDCPSFQLPAPFPLTPTPPPIRVNLLFSSKRAWRQKIYWRMIGALLLSIESRRLVVSHIHTRLTTASVAQGRSREGFENVRKMALALMCRPEGAGEGRAN